ncbi:bifunctional cytidylyltransferase/SDR family oxidoreductase [Actinocorallia longicatena]|uniref:2-C-methyl-D-erythritol 4-phosphate cytidylyltransferase n=1 Tax=Actinocorallia longicatena TaxID=111803 RepID=A0ABP6QH24_9ACTN
MRRNVAVVLAGGVGERMGLGIPKQLVRIAGRPVIEHTIRVFQFSPEIDEIVVMMAPGHLDEVRALVAAGGYGKVSRVLEGGATRGQTTWRAINAVDDECNLLFHDAVRPFLDGRTISDCVRALDTYDAVDVAIPSADTIITVDEYERTVLKDVPRRDLLRRGQTPQGFRRSTIRAAYEKALADPGFTSGRVVATDDCSVVLRYLPQVPIKVVEGAEANMKITHPVDLFLADKLFQLASDTVPSADRSLLAGRSVVVFGGAYGIGADICRIAAAHGATVHAFSRSLTGTNIEDPNAVERALAQAAKVSGRIDHVVNTAGLLRIGLLADTDDAEVDEIVRVNYLAPITIARAAHPHLRATGGQLLLFTSSSYTRGRAGYSIYSSTKAAIVNLTQALAEEWAPTGVRVNCVNPERTATPMRERAFGAEPAGSLLPSNAVALTAVDVLLSDLTGQVVDVRRPEVPPAREPEHARVEAL